MDFNNDYSKLKMRLFHHKQSDNVQFMREFKGYIYNGFSLLHQQLMLLIQKIITLYFFFMVIRMEQILKLIFLLI